MKKITNLDELRDLFGLGDDVIAFLKGLNMDTPCQKYHFGEDCFVNVMYCDTKQAEFTEKGQAIVETHKTYMDVQYIIEGEEQIFYGDATDAPVYKPHNEEKDVGFYLIDKYDSVCYKTGEAIALYPKDAHMPGCCVTQPKNIKKAVIKIRNK